MNETLFCFILPGALIAGIISGYLTSWYRDKRRHRSLPCIEIEPVNAPVDYMACEAGDRVLVIGETRDGLILIKAIPLGDDPDFAHREAEELIEKLKE